MTLKEKIENLIDASAFNPVGDSLEKIADDYAIEFAEWCIENEVFYAIKFGRMQTKELLEIFKKEKGL